MELQKYQDGRMWHLSPLHEFWKSRDAYERSSCRREWICVEELRSFAARQNFEAGMEILGHISEETAQEWLGWNPGSRSCWCFSGPRKPPYDVSVRCGVCMRRWGSRILRLCGRSFECSLVCVCCISVLSL